MKLKKILALLCGIFIVATCFSACNLFGKDSGNDNTGASSSSSSSSSSDEGTQQEPEDTRAILSVMSFNLQNWNEPEKRYDAVADQIKEYAPDILGTQEAADHWSQALEARLNGYKLVDLWGSNEIFYNAKRLKLLSYDMKFLSDTPDEYSTIYPGDIRFVTYAIFERREDGAKFFYANTHLNHVSEDTRVRQVEYLVDIIDTANTENYPVIVTGDFNADIRGSAYKKMDGSGYQNVAEVAKNSDGKYKYTFNGLASNDGRMIIDFVWVEEETDFGVRTYKVCDEKTVSDHYALFVELQY